MQFVIPNSGGFEDRPMIEFNACHAPEDGTFCSGRAAGRATAMKGERRAAVRNSFRQSATGKEDDPLGRRETRIRVNKGLTVRAERARSRAMAPQRNLDSEQAAYEGVKSRDAARRRSRFGVAKAAGTFSKPSMDMAGVKFGRRVVRRKK